MNHGLCPKCRTPLEADEVDVGVGTVSGPVGCPACHWVPEPLALVPATITPGPSYADQRTPAEHVEGFMRSATTLAQRAVADEIRSLRKQTLDQREQIQANLRTEDIADAERMGAISENADLRAKLSEALAANAALRAAGDRLHDDLVLYHPAADVLAEWNTLRARPDLGADLVVVPREVVERVAPMAEALRTQDNAGTHEPIFMVQRHVRTYGFDPSYSDNRIWLDNDDYVEITDFSEHQCPKCDKALTRDEFDDDSCASCEASLSDLHVTQTAYMDRWENVQPFLTRAGAEEYLRINGHNIRGKEPPRIYVEGSTRNAEWQAVRRLLADLAALLDGGKGRG